MTNSQNRDTYLCRSVTKILTLCRIKKICSLKYHEKAEIHSFPTMYIKGGQHLVKVSQNKDFLQKTASKTDFLRDTKLDQLTLEGAGTPNFKSTDIFGMFPEKLWA